MAGGSGGSLSLVTQNSVTPTAVTNTGTASASQGRDYKEKVIETYESSLMKVRRVALITVALYSFNWFVGFCTLTWATVVILGAFVQVLPKIDFCFVSVLILFEAIRLAVATFFTNIVTRSLTNESSDPREITYDDSARQTIVANTRIVSPVCQYVITLTTVVLPALRLPIVLQLDNGKDPYGLSWSLFIFYSLVLLNAIVAILAVSFSVLLAPRDVTSDSLYSYYDEVVWSGMRKGPLNASDFSLTFAFKLQAELYRRNKRAITVRNLYGDLLEYLYYHKKGFEAARIALDSTDSYEQEAAANIVGLWTKWDNRRRILGLQRRLLSKLADMVENEETGRSATSSFQQLAQHDPERALLVQSESREKLVDILMDGIDTLVIAEKYDRTLVYVKTLIPLLVNESCIQKLKDDNEQKLNGLERNLEKIFESNPKNCLKRSKAIAGYALRAIDKSKPTQPEELRPTQDQVKTRLLDPELRTEVKTGKLAEYILRDEYEYLLDLIPEELERPERWERERDWVRRPDVEPLNYQQRNHKRNKRNIVIASGAILVLIVAFLLALLSQVVHNHKRYIFIAICASVLLIIVVFLLALVQSTLARRSRELISSRIANFSRRFSRRRCNPSSRRIAV